MAKIVTPIHAKSEASRVSFRFLGACLPVIATAILMTFFFTYSTTGDDLQSEKVFAAILAIAASLPLAMYLGVRRSFAPLFATNTLYYIFAYSLGPFFLNADPRFVMEASEVDFPLIVCFTGLGSQIIGYYFAQYFPFRCPVALQMPKPKSLQVAVLGWFMLIASQIPLLFPEILKVPSVGQGFRLFLYSGVAVVAARLLSIRGRHVEKCLFGVILPFVLIAGLLSGSAANASVICLILAVAAGAVGRLYFGFLFLIVGCLVLFAVNPIKSQYRLLYWRTDDTTAISTKAFVFANLLIDFWSKPRSFNDQLSEKNNLLTIDRINQFPLLARVVSMTPDEVPYWKGESFEGLAFSLIPRIVWPDKPQRTFGNKFGHRYFILHSTDSTTSLNLPWLVEFYANAGIAAVVIAFALIGVFFQFAEKWFLTMTEDKVANTLMIGLLAPLAFPESDFVVMFGTIFLGILTLKFSYKLIEFLF